MERISTEQLKFIDEFGRERIFNGIAFPDKLAFHNGSRRSMVVRVNRTDAFFDLLKVTGINLVRLGLNWEAIEPQPKKYNEEYIAAIKTFFAKCEERDIYVMLDMHQDIYSGYIEGGNGAPRWATMTDGKRQHKAKAVWAEGYFFSKACHRAFDNFWDNRPYKGKGLQDWFAEMWAHLAEVFADCPNLFGYDFFNEPFPGTKGGKIFRRLIVRLVGVTLFDRSIKLKQFFKFLRNPKKLNLMLEQYSDRHLRKIVDVGKKYVREFDLTKYSPFINRVATAVRAVTDKGIIAIENCYYSNIGVPCSTPPIKINGERAANQCFAPHAYDIMVDTPDYEYASNERVGEMFAEHRRTQERMQMPIVVGEWGGFNSDHDSLEHARFLMKTFEHNHWSQMYWAFDLSIFDSPYLEVLDKTYAVAVTGTIVDYSYDYEQGVYTLKYNQDREFEVDNLIRLHTTPIAVEGVDKYEITDEDNCQYLRFATGIGEHTLTVRF